MVHVVSCEFLRLGCSENHPLFRREYARSNRERGVKLLRCFPHCCPQHVKRSYCGCSVHVLVTFSTDVSTLALDNLLVSARFEPTRVTPLWPESLAGLAQDLGAPGADNSQEKCRLNVGENVLLPASLWSTPIREQSEGSEEWVRSERQATTKQQLPKNAILYVLNSGRAPKWFYSYDSSVTRTQREMTHHLVVYVFSLQHANPRGGDNATVLARHASPAFLLVSYRRSRAASNPGCELPAMNIPEQTPERKLPIDFLPTEAYGRKRQVVATDEGDSRLWQFQADLYHPGFREKSLHLFILWGFLQCLSMEDINITRLNTQRYWLRVASVLQNPQLDARPQLDDIVTSFLEDIFSTAEGVDISIKMTVYLLLRTLFSSTFQGLIRSSLKDNSQLHDRLALLISRAYDFFEEELYEISSGISVSSLVDNLLSLVYSQRRFRAHRGHFSSLLMGQTLANALDRAFHALKAQSGCGVNKSRLGKAPSTCKNPLQSAWSRRWLLEPGSVKLSDGASDVFPTLQVVDVAQFLLEFGCVQLELESDLFCLALRSELSLTGGSSISLTLDGRLRSFSNFSSGLWAVGALGRWSFGDYAGLFSDGEQSLDVDVFVFSMEGTRALLRRIQLKLSLEQRLSNVDARDLLLLVQGAISGSFYEAPRDSSDDFSKLHIQDRAAMYESLDWTFLLDVQTKYISFSC